jgi:hypothetical protein
MLMLNHPEQPQNPAFFGAVTQGLNKRDRRKGRGEGGGQEERKRKEKRGEGGGGLAKRTRHET